MYSRPLLSENATSSVLSQVYGQASKQSKDQLEVELAFSGATQTPEQECWQFDNYTPLRVMNMTQRTASSAPSRAPVPTQYPIPLSSSRPGCPTAHSKYHLYARSSKSPLPLKESRDFKHRPEKSSIRNPSVGYQQRCARRGFTFNIPTNSLPSQAPSNISHTYTETSLSSGETSLLALQAEWLGVKLAIGSTRDFIGTVERIPHGTAWEQNPFQEEKEVPVNNLMRFQSTQGHTNAQLTSESTVPDQDIGTMPKLEDILYPAATYLPRLTKSTAHSLNAAQSQNNGRANPTTIRTTDLVGHKEHLGQAQQLALPGNFGNDYGYHNFGIENVAVLADIREDKLEIKQVISHKMSLGTIIEHLVNHGCADVTLQLKKVDEHPRYSGSLSDVYQARWADGSLVAVKSLRALTNADVPRGKILKRTAHELYTWSRASHPNILRLHGLAVVNDKLAMVAPWMAFGSLLAYIDARPQVDRCHLCAQIARGLLYMHNLGLVHGDIKGNNVVISEDGTAKLTDFGSTAMAQEFAIAFTATQTVNYSIRWAAPELFQSQIACYETDVYAYAKTVLEALTGEVPHCGLTDFAIILSVGGEGKLPERPVDHIPPRSMKGDELWDMLVSCWNMEPMQRPRISEVCRFVRLYHIRRLMQSVTQDELKDMPLEFGSTFDAEDRYVI